MPMLSVKCELCENLIPTGLGVCAADRNYAS